MRGTGPPLPGDRGPPLLASVECCQVPPIPLPAANPPNHQLTQPPTANRTPTFSMRPSRMSGANILLKSLPAQKDGKMMRYYYSTKTVTRRHNRADGRSECRGSGHGNVRRTPSSPPPPVPV